MSKKQQDTKTQVEVLDESEINVDQATEETQPKTDRKPALGGDFKVEINYPIHFRGHVYEPGEVVTDEETANRLYQINKVLIKEYN